MTNNEMQSDDHYYCYGDDDNYDGDCDNSYYKDDKICPMLKF